MLSSLGPFAFTGSTAGHFQSTVGAISPLQCPGIACSALLSSSSPEQLPFYFLQLAEVLLWQPELGVSCCQYTVVIVDWGTMLQ